MSFNNSFDLDKYFIRQSIKVYLAYPDPCLNPIVSLKKKYSPKYTKDNHCLS